MQESSSLQSPAFYRSVRSRVLGMTVALAFLTYLDRVCISVTAPAIMRDLHLSAVQMGFAFSAFTAAYALFEVPTGWWADRIGSRRVLTRIVLWWSVFTGLTAAAWNFPSLLALRALFGAGEAGAWPTVARTISRWFPARERGTA
jgi:MFS transporter, ACS family, glucarate transporter